MERLALLGAARVGRDEGSELRQHREDARWRCGALTHRGAELAQEQDLRGFAGLVGGFPVPCAFGIRSAEGGDHGGAAHPRIDRPAAFKMGEEQDGTANGRIRAIWWL